MKIQSVAILGAGAVGCYVLWGLADKAAANSLQLGVVAEGSRAERLRQNGCTINGQVYHPQVWTPQQAHGVDLLIVALKYGALPGALDSIRTIVSERTVVMSLMNGVDSEELITHRSAQLMCCPRSSRWPPTAPGTVCVLTRRRPSASSTGS